MDAGDDHPGRFNDPEGFTEDQVRAIVAAAACTDEAARTRLAFQVQKWSSTRRYYWLRRLGEQTRLSAKARQELLALADIAEAYALALDRLSPEQCDYLIGNFGGRGDGCATPECFNASRRPTILLPGLEMR